MNLGISAVCKQEQNKMIDRIEQLNVSYSKLKVASDCPSDAIEKCDQGDFLAVIQDKRDIAPILSDIASTDFESKSPESVHTLQFHSKLEGVIKHCIQHVLSCAGQVIDFIIEKKSSQYTFVGQRSTVSFKLSRLSGKVTLADTQGIFAEIKNPYDSVLVVSEEYDWKMIEYDTFVKIDIWYEPVFEGRYQVILFHTLPRLQVNEAVLSSSPPQSSPLKVDACTQEVIDISVSISKAALGKFKAKISVAGRCKFVGPMKVKLVDAKSRHEELVCRVTFNEETKKYIVQGCPNKSGQYILKLNISDEEIDKEVWVTDGKISAKAGLCILGHLCTVVVQGIETLRSVQIELFDPIKRKVNWKRVDRYSRLDRKHRLTFTPQSEGNYTLQISDKNNNEIQCQMIIPCCFLCIEVTNQSGVVGSICKATIEVKQTNGIPVDLSRQVFKTHVQALVKESPNSKRKAHVRQFHRSIRVTTKKDYSDDGKSVLLRFVPHIPCTYVISVSVDQMESLHNYRDKEIEITEYRDFGPTFLYLNGFNQPSDMSYSRASNTVLVADTKVNGLMKQLDLDGNVIATLKAPITGESMCACDSNGNVFILYPEERQLFMYLPKKAKFEQFRLPYTVKKPTAICVNAEDELLISDTSEISTFVWNNKVGKLIEIRKVTFLRSVGDDVRWHTIQIGASNQAIFVSEWWRSVVLQYDESEQRTQSYKITGGGKSGGIAVASTKNAEYLLISMQYDHKNSVDIYKVHKREGGAFIGRIPVEQEHRPSHRHLDKLIVFCDGQFLKLDGENHCIRKYGFIREPGVKW